MGPNFLLRIPNTPDNVETHIDAIRDFVARWKGRRVPRRELEHLDHEHKEQQRLEFFERVLRG